MGEIGLVVNYYWLPSFKESTRWCTGLALATLKEEQDIGTILLVDGSPEPDSIAKDMCSKIGVEYVYVGHKPIAEAYNIGWRTLSEPYVGFMANDVIPLQGTIKKLSEWVRLPDVGCVFPYLTSSDNPMEVMSYSRKQKNCEPSAMTFNLNILKRSVLGKIGGIDEGYSGGYNDVILLMKVRELGFRVVLVGQTCAFHFGKMTVGQHSLYTFENDKTKFREEYPRYYSKYGFWNITHWRRPFAKNLITSIMWWCAQSCPLSQIRNKLLYLARRLEPLFTQCKKRAK